MGADSKIEWCDHTFNPWEGCTKVSPGCVNCYAETRNARFGGGTAPNWGAGKPRRRTVAHNWDEPRRWNRNVATYGRRPRVFCASLADWLDDEVPPEWLTDLLQVIHETPNLDWLLLTKRPQKFMLRMEAAWNAREEHNMGGAALAHNWKNGDAPANVWFGFSAEDQKRFDERVPYLKTIRARVNFVSFEPLLEPICIVEGGPVSYDPPEQDVWFPHQIDWAIIGGESGKGSRPCELGWIRSLVSQLRIGEVYIFVKQLGSRPFSFNEPEGRHFKSLNMDVPPVSEYHLQLNDKKGGDITEWPEDLRIREFPA